jgi:glyoxylase-like metal-dependent hydrolase (beta-lactamase superfamily II)
MQTDQDFHQISPSVRTHTGAVNVSIIIINGEAVLIDCDDSLSPATLKTAKLPIPKIILCTQHRRTHTAGIPGFVKVGSKVVGSRAEKALFEHNDEYWRDSKNRWHIYHHQPGPLVPVEPIPLSRVVGDGDVIPWQGIDLRVIGTPGVTRGSISYLCEVDGVRIVSCGDLVYGHGQLLDLYSLQHSYREVGDYHGFLGSKDALVASLDNVLALHPEVLIPSHGPVLRGAGTIQQAGAMLKARLASLWSNYMSISSLNFYFPGVFSDFDTDPARMAPGIQVALPPFFRRIAGTSFGLVSDDGALFLIDCGSRAVAKKLHDWQKRGIITAVEACWITHYHDDHVDGLGDLLARFQCPVIADIHVAEIIEHPERFFLPCISPVHAAVSKTTGERETWKWHEFTLTAMHLPGQTYHHGGLLVEGHGCKILVAGDCASPSGIDDYCAPNRTFLRDDAGYFKCISRWREDKPDLIVNCHQEKGFAFSPDKLAYMERQLRERVRILKELLPWPDPTFGLDDSWIRMYPYDQAIKPGEEARLEVHVTNHCSQEMVIKVEPVLPVGWRLDRDGPSLSIAVPPATAGTASPLVRNPDGRIRLTCHTPARALKGLVLVTCRVWWGEQYLGPVCHARVRLA